MSNIDPTIQNALDDSGLFINQPLDVPKIDPGAHYSFKLADGTLMDPYKIAQLYGMTSFPLMTVLKKILVCGGRGYKDQAQDIRDCIKALERELELINES